MQNAPLNFMAWHCSQNVWAKFLMNLSLVLPQLAVFSETAFLQCPLKWCSAQFFCLMWDSPHLNMQQTHHRMREGGGWKALSVYFFLDKLLLLLFIAFCIKNKKHLFAWDSPTWEVLLFLMKSRSHWRHTVSFCIILDLAETGERHFFNHVFKLSLLLSG